jgi:hypothetical protein
MLASLALVGVPAAASAAAVSSAAQNSGPKGYDVSYPQKGR